MQCNRPPEWAIRTLADSRALEMGCYWQQSKGDEVVSFAHAFFQSQFSTGKFTLYQWQERFIRSVYSWRLPTGKRRFRYANLHIAKKAGKTMLTSIICAFELLCGKEPSPMVLAGACSIENAGQIYNEVKHSFSQSGLAEFLEFTDYRKTIFYAENNARFKVVSKSGEQGPNATCVILDEAAFHTSDKLFTSLSPAGKHRDDSICVYISTAGDDVSHFYYSDVYQKSKRIIDGTDTDILWYAQVHEADPESDLSDPVQWRKANPSPFDEYQFGLELASAKDNSGAFLNFKRKFLNIWTKAEEHAWLDVSDWDKHANEVTEERLRECSAWIGVDLSTSGADPSSVSIVWHLREQRFHVRSWAWTTEDSTRERNKSNLPKYSQFIDQQSMVMTEGDRIDDALILDHIFALCRDYRVMQINYDPASGGHIFMGQVEREGWKTAPFPPFFKFYNGVMREFERAYKEIRITHDGSNTAWLKYCLSNVRLDVNKDGMIRPYKKKSIDKIDGAVSCLVAFITACQEAVNDDAPAFLML
ncbi:terminase TerL endonuclease subunit [Zavarzinella formosa]|uniref:terminase TerL endonuclease subunit n=1 Tax=Zavarzinella formosa TaxID=360055 RepID=UPI0002D6B0EE|nr:terminase TerL endonuclease subunit [Zavarzinella formosa]